MCSLAPYTTSGYLIGMMPTRTELRSRSRLHAVRLFCGRFTRITLHGDSQAKTCPQSSNFHRLHGEVSRSIWYERHYPSDQKQSFSREKLLVQPPWSFIVFTILKFLNNIEHYVDHNKEKQIYHRILSELNPFWDPRQSTILIDPVALMKTIKVHHFIDSLIK